MPYLQALLDVYTIQRELGRLDNLRIGLVGDLANGRTVRSLAYLLSMYSGIKFFFVAPDVVRMQVCQYPACPLPETSQKRGYVRGPRESPACMGPMLGLQMTGHAYLPC